MVVARLKRLVAAGNEPVDAASLAFFRAAFGTLMVIAASRFFTHDWIETDYRAPTHFLHYWGFGWVRPLPHPGMYFVYGIAALAGVAIALGIAHRPACVVFAGLFTYAHLIDKSHYLNHYYLVGLLALLLSIVPLDRRGSVPVRAWMLWLLRFQIAIVYFFGGLAKVGHDWLIEAEPLRIWLAANVELPLIGRALADGRVAYLFAWGGMLFDLTIVPLLLWRRTRAAAYVAVVAFHLMTSLLFHIGMFPWIMMVAATLFFDPSWPRRWSRSSAAKSTAIAGPPLGRVSTAVVAAYAVVQLLLPLRHFAYPGNTLWSEEGFRFAWRVMLIEKSGELELTVVDREGHRSVVDPRSYLTPFQTRMTATQPDMILELAHIVARDRAALTGGPVQVYADAMVSFNGRMRARLVDPTVDLAAEEDSLGPKRWILPSPNERPVF